MNDAHTTFRTALGTANGTSDPGAPHLYPGGLLPPFRQASGVSSPVTGMRYDAGTETTILAHS